MSLRMKLGHTIEDSKIKYPELTDKLLDNLQKWTQFHGLSQIPQEQLALLAHSRYFQQDATLQCMSVYYKMRATTPEFFGNRDPKHSSLQHSLRTMEIAELPVPDHHGNRIIFNRLVDFRPSQYMLNDSIKLLGMTVDASLYTEGCSPGYIFLFDMHGVKLTHLTRLSIGTVQKLFQYIQEGLPIRLKAIHVLNTVWFIERLISIVKPFMNAELFNLTHFHTGDVSDVYEYIPKECLPKDLGGELDYAKNFHKEHCLKLDKLRDYFLEEENVLRNYHSVTTIERGHKYGRSDTNVERKETSRDSNVDNNV